MDVACKIWIPKNRAGIRIRRCGGGDAHHECRPGSAIGARTRGAGAVVSPLRVRAGVRVGAGGVAGGVTREELARDIDTEGAAARLAPVHPLQLVDGKVGEPLTFASRYVGYPRSLGFRLDKM